MSWWEEQRDRRRTAINAVLDSQRGTGCLNYADGDRGFAAWLLVADVTCTRRFAVSIFDLVDWSWRDAYDAGEQPESALRDALEADGVVVGMGDGE
ncbi:MAG: hypothetical protein QOE61_684 [Micromonosporaceae bacterium]|jgi:hypothetical protein|nr:hypothetical protein [Micromonosporaceae bacterium]